MFTRQFDRKVHRALAALGLAVLLGIGYGYYVLWPSNMEAGYQPAQPVAFSHKLHAGDMKMECLYCHAQAEEQALATVPPLSVCMKCHLEVQPKDKAGQIKPDTRLLLDRWGRQEPILWQKVNDLADFVYFQHGRHVSSGIHCQECHGPVETMERVRRQYGLKMSWCLECHRQPPPKGSHAEEAQWSTRAPIECWTCHN
jgi:menaquinone reductase, multiheme cytochrome c subunit